MLTTEDASGYQTTIRSWRSRLSKTTLFQDNPNKLVRLSSNSFSFCASPLWFFILKSFKIVQNVPPVLFQTRNLDNSVKVDHRLQRKFSTTPGVTWTWWKAKHVWTGNFFSVGKIPWFLWQFSVSTTSLWVGRDKTSDTFCWEKTHLKCPIPHEESKRMKRGYQN